MSAHHNTGPMLHEVQAMTRYATKSESLANLRGNVEELRRLANGRHVPTTTQLEDLAKRMECHIENCERIAHREALKP